MNLKASHLLAIFAVLQNFLLVKSDSFAGGDVSSHARCAPITRRAAPAADFDWSTITPSPTLNWTSCYEIGQCARFSVPLNYSNPDGGRAAIAMFKIPSTANSTTYKGPILFNNGGPGDAGTSLILSSGQLFSKIFGPDYDIIGFDPRGVGFTTPSLSLFLSNPEFALWQASQPPLINSTSDALGRNYARWQLSGALADARGGQIARLASTPVVARDMLEIMRAHGREKLLYYGISYGTVLGATYATMYPDKVERIVLDGVMDPEDYYSTQWANNLNDTHKALKFFYAACSAGGASQCPLYDPSPAKIALRVNAILDSLKARPIPVIGDLANSSYAIIDYSRVQGWFLGQLYAPTGYAPTIAAAFAALETRNVSLISAVLGDALSNTFPCDTCNASSEFNRAGEYVSTASQVIRCTDGAPVTDDYGEVEAHFERLAKKSQFADAWTVSRAQCVGWKVRADWQFKGPTGANTSFPILLIGNTADTATPIAGAHTVSRTFNGSVVLTQNSPGHASLASVSNCTYSALRTYFNDGVLPRPNTVCEIDDVVFGVNASTIMATVNAPYSNRSSLHEEIHVAANAI